MQRCFAPALSEAEGSLSMTSRIVFGIGCLHKADTRCFFVAQMGEAGKWPASVATAQGPLRKLAG